MRLEIGISVSGGMNGVRRGLMPGTAFTSATLLRSWPRRRDHAAVKADAQAIYQASRRADAESDAQLFAHRWREAYPQLVTRLLWDLPKLVAFFHGPRAFGARSGRPM